MYMYQGNQFIQTLLLMVQSLLKTSLSSKCHFSIKNYSDFCSSVTVLTSTSRRPSSLPECSDSHPLWCRVASNFNQALVRAHLLNSNDDPEFQIAVIEEAMANFHRYFFIMPTLARFELEIHERVERGQALNADSLIALLAELFGEGYGREVEQDHDRIGITWAQFHTHLYSNFYVYQYATGISAAHSLARGILAGKPGASDNFLRFLKAGGSVFPLEALQIAGLI